MNPVGTSIKKENSVVIIPRNKPLVQTAGQQSNMEALFHRLKSKVLEKKPLLRGVFENHGTKSIYQYVGEHLTQEVPISATAACRRQEFISTFQAEIASTLGDDIARGAAQQLSKYYVVSTANHHGPIGHPFFLNGDMAMALPYASMQDPTLQYAIILATSNIGFNNLSFPRGLLYQSYTENTVHMNELPFFPRKIRQCPVYNFHSYTREDIVHSFDFLKEHEKTRGVSTIHIKKLESIIQEVYQDDQALRLKTFSEQVTKTNYTLWQKYFEHTNCTKPCDLLYLDQDKLVVRLLLDHHIGRRTIIHDILFDPDYSNSLIKYFNGIQGAFSLEENVGTYLFWHVSKDKHYRFALRKKDNYLITDDGKYRVELTPGGIAEALKAGELIPSIMIDFFVLALYYGLKCLGGPSQINYLTAMKQGFIAMQQEHGDQESVQIAQSVCTDRMITNLALAFLRDPKEDSYLMATGLDLILYGKDIWGKFIEESKQITMAQILDVMMPQIYRFAYSEPYQEEDLLSVTIEELIKLFDLESKILPCGVLGVTNT